MKNLLTVMIATIGLSGITSYAFASQQTTASSDMQHYVFTYQFNTKVDLIAAQYVQTRQALNYRLALDIQDQVYSNLSNIISPNNSVLAMRTSHNNSRLGDSE